MTRDLFTIDPALETALRDIRHRVTRLRTGRLTAELHLLAGQVVEVRMTEDRTTEREVERVMQERPKWRRG